MKNDIDSIGRTSEGCRRHPELHTWWATSRHRGSYFSESKHLSVLLFEGVLCLGPVGRQQPDLLHDAGPELPLQLVTPGGRQQRRFRITPVP